MSNRRAFTLVELLMIVGIIGLLVTIAMPVLGRAMFMARRAACSAQVNAAVKGLVTYAAANNGRFPTTGDGWKSSRFDVIGANVTDGDLDFTTATRNSNSRNLFLAVRTKYVDPAALLCPAVKGGEAANLVDGSNRTLYDFDVNVGGEYVNKLDYSFHLQFGSRHGGRKGWPLVQTSDQEMAVLADKNPHVVYPGAPTGGGFRAKSVAIGTDHNSPNHRYRGENEGQNVGYPDGHVKWNTTPHAGPLKDDTRDNIYTVWTAGGDVETGEIAADSMPRDRKDSFLVP